MIHCWDLQGRVRLSTISIGGWELIKLDTRCMFIGKKAAGPVYLFCAAGSQIPDAQCAILRATTDLVAVRQLHHPTSVQGVAPQHLRRGRGDLRVKGNPVMLSVLTL